jgi:hypothetical protein
MRRVSMFKKKKKKKKKELGLKAHLSFARPITMDGLGPNKNSSPLLIRRAKTTVHKKKKSSKIMKIGVFPGSSSIRETRVWFS